jgi:hypothetical protein
MGFAEIVEVPLSDLSERELTERRERIAGRINGLARRLSELDTEIEKRRSAGEKRLHLFVSGGVQR